MSAMDEDSAEDEDGLNPWGDPIEIDVRIRRAGYSMPAHASQILAFTLSQASPCADQEIVTRDHRRTAFI